MLWRVIVSCVLVWFEWGGPNVGLWDLVIVRRVETWYWSLGDNFVDFAREDYG